MSAGTVQLNIYIVGQSKAVSVLEVPENTTVDDLKTINRRFKEKGFEVRLNGETPAQNVLDGICESLSRDGMTVRINGSPAAGGATLPAGGLVTASPNYKGN